MVESLASVFPHPPVQDGDKTRLAKDGLRCTIVPQSVLGRELVEEVFGIETNTLAVCSPARGDLEDASMETLFNVVLWLSAEHSCDFVLLHDGEAGLLRRRNGVLEGDPKEEYWSNWWRRLDFLGIPVRLTSLASL